LFFRCGCLLFQMSRVQPSDPRTSSDLPGADRGLRSLDLEERGAEAHALTSKSAVIAPVLDAASAVQTGPFLNLLSFLLEALVNSRSPLSQGQLFSMSTSVAVSLGLVCRAWHRVLFASSEGNIFWKNVTYLRYPHLVRLTTLKIRHWYRFLKARMAASHGLIEVSFVENCNFLCDDGYYEEWDRGCPKLFERLTRLDPEFGFCELCGLQVQLASSKEDYEMCLANRVLVAFEPSVHDESRSGELKDGFPAHKQGESYLNALHNTDLYLAKALDLPPGSHNGRLTWIYKVDYEENGRKGF